MARIDTVRPDAAPVRAMNDTGSAADAPLVATLGTPVGAATALPALDAFRAGRSDAERTADLLAYAIATERGLPPTPDAIERARQDANAALGDYSLRYLHNHVAQLRQEAVAEHLGRLRPPPSLIGLVIANLVALALAGALCLLAWTRPEVRAAAARLLGG
jgi:hypothetical protein